MKFFIDFEAMQFANYIIGIGCVNERGDSFSTLVRLPEGKKINKFITELTGITNEMLEEAPPPDEAFNLFFDFVVAHSDGVLPQYYCYGSNDKSFITRTMTKMTDVKALVFAKSIVESLTDYSKNVKSFFKTPDNISLQKIYNLIQQEETPQHHNALEDAQMLQAVVANLHSCTPEDKVIIDAMPKAEKPWPTPKKAPDKFVNWPGNMWEANTKEPGTPWVICAQMDGHNKTFDSMDTAVLWAIRYVTRGLSPKKEQHLKEVEKKIRNAIDTGAKYYNLFWFDQNTMNEKGR